MCIIWGLLGRPGPILTASARRGKATELVSRTALRLATVAANRRTNCRFDIAVGLYE